MKQNPFGLHIMDAGVNDAEFWAYLRAARPASCVVLNHHVRAQAIKAEFPSMRVIHRQYNPNDYRWHEIMTPEAWLAQHKDFGANGVYVQCMNEPGGDFRNDAAYRDRFVEWLVRLIALAGTISIRLALPNWSTGNPHESTVLNGGFDRLIRACAGNADVLFGVHEYWHTDPAAEYPWLIGRHEFWADRAATLGLPPLNFILTEYGMDKGGGQGDGWRNQGISDAAYSDQLKRSRTLLAHKPPGNLYCFGTGFGWNSFDISGSSVPDALKGYTEDVPVVTEPMPPTYESCVVTAIDGNAVRIRQQPSTASATLGYLSVYSTVQADITTLIPTDGGTSEWYRIPAGYVAHRYKGAFISTIERATTVPAPIRLLDVPYVSQEGKNAALRTNDCFIASALMVYQFRLQRAGLGFNHALTVDSVIAASPLAQDNDPVTLAEGLSFCQTLGLNAAIRQDLTREKLIELLDSGTPAIPLVRYRYILPGDVFEGGHYLVVVGYGVTGFWVHDPYHAGASAYVSNEAMDAALTDLGTAASGDYQGIVAT